MLFIHFKRRQLSQNYWSLGRVIIFPYCLNRYFVSVVHEPTNFVSLFLWYERGKIGWPKIKILFIKYSFQLSSKILEVLNGTCENILFVFLCKKRNRIVTKLWLDHYFKNYLTDFNNFLNERGSFFRIIKMGPVSGQY